MWLARDKEHGRANLNHLDFSSALVRLGRNRFMPRPLAKSTFVLLVLSLWILAFPGSMADDNNDPDALNQQVTELIAQWKFQEALQIAREALELAKRTRGLEDPE